MTDETTEAPVEPRIVQAVMSASAHGTQGGKTALAKLVEDAMAKAIRDAMAEGVSLDNSDELRARQIAARDRAVEEYRLAEAAMCAEVEAKIAREKADEAARVAAEAQATAKAAAEAANKSE